MKLKQYLLREARVRKTNADVFLYEYAPIFLWNPNDGFLWAAFNKENSKWDLYHWSKRFSSKQGSDYFTHNKLMEAYKGSSFDWKMVDNCITGRISPDGKTIYVHSSGSRTHLSREVVTHYDRWVNKAVDNVYRYMKDYIK